VEERRQKEKITGAVYAVSYQSSRTSRNTGHAWQKVAASQTPPNSCPGFKSFEGFENECKGDKTWK
jgi:hypothetical protein